MPERVFMAGSNGHDGNGSSANPTPTGGLLGLLVSLLVAEKSGFQLGVDSPELGDLRSFAEKPGQRTASDARTSGPTAGNRRRK